MNFVYHIEVPASVEAVWDLLWQAERVGACLPGCEQVTTIEPLHRYEAIVAQRVGPFKARFAWEIAVERCDPLERIRVVARGRDRALAATARAEMEVRVEPADRGTALDLQTELQITGKVATLGQVVIKRKADQVVREFAEALRMQLEAADKGNPHA